jgi:hypothetical protein
MMDDRLRVASDNVLPFPREGRRRKTVERLAWAIIMMRGALQLAAILAAGAITFLAGLGLVDLLGRLGR